VAGDQVELARRVPQRGASSREERRRQRDRLVALRRARRADVAADPLDRGASVPRDARRLHREDEGSARR
jgi:hypothetical protein